MSGYLGIKKTLDRVVSEFFWLGVCGDVARFCKPCDICQRTSEEGRVARVHLGKLPLTDTQLKRLAVNKVGSIEPCIDFRKLNKVTEFDAEPMPNMEEDTYIFPKWT